MAEYDNPNLPEDYPEQKRAELPDLAAFVREIEDALNGTTTPVIGYCGWPDCPICRDRGLIPDDAENEDKMEVDLQ